ncbi:MAG TPA: S8 family serine peptidase [Actinomycetota bacterium]|nr:S8 family serine peptidase [Actinomycetota bacterium]
MRRRSIAAALIAALALALVGSLPSATASSSRPGGPLREYIVLYEAGSSFAEGRSAVEAAGGRVVEEIASIGVARVTTRNAGFVLDATAEAAISGASRNRVIGYSDPALREKVDEVEAIGSASSAQSSQVRVSPRQEPLADLQWGMKLIHATARGSYAIQQGSPQVRVGIIDTGIDASHPDLDDNVNRSLSRNFTTDIPLIDGPCEDEPDRSCSDPATVDEGGHGTHVAGIVAAELNGLGVAGVAPEVTLVNLRAGQDSGFFFLFETLAAYTFAADHGIDVVNMSFFTDPWEFNCRNNPLDSPEAQRQQATVIDASNRALQYAWRHGVSLLSSSGNSHTDLDNPTYDAFSPDFPPGSEYIRDNITDDCLDIPTEGAHVMTVNAVGPSGRKAYYSNYGFRASTVSAPGGDRREFFGTPRYDSPNTRILSTYPADLAMEEGLIGPRFGSLNPFAVVDCVRRPRNERNCGVYVYLQGTSMASPHAAGVAALIVSEYGSGSGAGFGLAPRQVERILRRTATNHACPSVSSAELYPDLVGLDPNVPFEDQVCVGTAEYNSWYGAGIVDALAAVR